MDGVRIQNGPTLRISKNIYIDFGTFSSKLAQPVLAASVYTLFFAPWIFFFITVTALSIAAPFSYREEAKKEKLSLQLTKIV